MKSHSHPYLYPFLYPHSKAQKQTPTPRPAIWNEVEAVLEFDHESILFGPWSPSEQALSHGGFLSRWVQWCPLKSMV